MAMTIRQATPADAPIIVEYNRLMALETEDKVLDPEVLGAGVQAALDDPQKLLYFLAMDDGQVVGQLGVTTEWSDWRNGYLWWIQSVYVPAQARRKGVFRALYKHVYEAACAEGNVIGLRLNVDRDNEKAQKTYLSLGMEWTDYLTMQRFPL
jgi:GNAT superfamily N-acetyltransferase